MKEIIKEDLVCLRCYLKGAESTTPVPLRSTVDQQLIRY